MVFMSKALEKIKNLDELDIKILTILTENARISFNKLAERLNISVATAAARVRKLENLGIIEKYTIKINCKKIGFEGGSFLFLKIRGDVDEVVKKLITYPEIRGIYRISGDYDLLVCGSCVDLDTLTDLIDKINKIDKVVDVKKVVIFDIYKEQPYPEPEVFRKALFKAMKLASK